MKVLETALPGVLLLEPQVFGDERGFFMETYHAERYAAAGIERAFVQDNVSRSGHGILRGLHLQHPHAQGKLVYVLEGEVFDVAVDARVGSPTFGHWVGALLSATNKRQLWVPEGFAHGFCVTSEHALFCYKCTDLYHPETELSIRWDDPALGIDWPVRQPRLSQKDAQARCLDAIEPQRLPVFSVSSR
ncbi:dTDP-4-dehydrorhamnose 3,5-epimerase [Thioalkalivibrio paradoxus]|uniref:dTDP-4-dehydrorhamnose 3,5-epimerase n=1 Tax=Thioalkalivibrio paradoxus ARh 1 TaxID=713585 RepID=W0DNV1_9GAMM|nr:dTDP-4-dehydrorhamnose 3,5-epimerase [Thioalkalivibrio paradoxus]AHE98560.1 dTDP-4-dehydrorhamnose 3,5-epimerase [Thioalkalivibrio paradoxus ARh 1]